MTQTIHDIILIRSDLKIGNTATKTDLWILPRANLPHLIELFRSAIKQISKDTGEHVRLSLRRVPLGVDMSMEWIQKPANSGNQTTGRNDLPIYVHCVEESSE